MFTSFTQRTTVFLMLFSMTFASGTARADDTEIYFSSGSATGNTTNAILPSVLMILDTSGSMTATVSGTGGKSRMALMKEAMRDIIGNVEDVRMGLMRFTRTEGGAVVFPIAGIDQPAFEIVSEPNDSRRTLSYSVITSSDDAEEAITAGNPVTINDAILNLNQLPPPVGTVTSRINSSDDDVDEFGGNSNPGATPFYNDTALQAARFTGLNIPDGATIINTIANPTTLTLTERTTVAAGGTNTITGELVTNCGDYSSPAFNEVSGRLVANPTPTTYAHTVLGGIGGTEVFDNANLTALIQELVNVDAGVNGNPLCLFSQCSGGSCSGTWQAYDGSPANAPLLTVSYNSAGTAANQISGFRFQNVEIPQGATIVDAKLKLTAASNDTDLTDVIKIRVEDADDSTTFTTAGSNISGRTLAAKTTTWTLPETTADTEISSCVDGTCTGNTLAQVIQQVTDRTNWCGGNSLNVIVEFDTGNKDFYSYDGNSGLAPELEISYDTTGSLGCVVATETAQIATSADDVENSGTGGSQLDFQPNNNIGLRFQDIDIPQGATILDARISITARRNDTGSSTDINIWTENSDNPNSYGNVNSRNKATGTGIPVLWEPTNWSQNSVYQTPNLKDIVQPRVNSAGWASGNAMAFIMETTGPNRRGRSYNDSTTRAPRLSITYRATASFSPVKTVRQKLIELTDDFPTSDWTPITEVMYEAAHYWRGEEVIYGKGRDGIRQTRLSHPATYCDGDNDCNGANTGTYPPYGVFDPSGCSVDNLDAYACRNRSIQGNPNYISPFNTELSCASNYQVLLTDGQANTAAMESTIESEFVGEDFGEDVDGDGDGDGQCRNQTTTGGSISTAQKCAIDLTEFMFRADQSTATVGDNLDNAQTVITYTVGFNFSAQYLEDMATEAGGAFFEATTASDLVTVFDTILTDVKSSPTSFVAPSLATNAFNRLLSRDEVYFGLFTPELNASWDGNVKKYNVCIETDPDGDGTANCVLGSILDQTGGLAIDGVTDRFKETAQSFWSASADGLTTTSGGTGAEFDDFGERIIYTESATAPASGTALNGSGYKITEDNWDDAALANVRTAVCPTPSTTSGSECEDRMLWMLGKVLLIEETDVDADTRWTVNDVLHSSPSIITYGGADTDADGVIETFYDKLVYGSNDGAIHFVNASDSSGKEEWSFIPDVLINNQQTIYTNAEGDHLYGMDLTPVVHRFDANGNGTIETGDGDFTHIISGMRRGGNLYYALDVSANVTSISQTVTPRFLWRIEGGTGDYARLGQTWSRPVLGTIATTTGAQTVMVFGGGYDTALDSGYGTAATGGSNNIGNMIYVANPITGNLIFSIGGNGSGADITVADMKYAIPSRVTLLDSDGDSISDRIYVGDTGGQVWRVDLGSDVNFVTGAPGSTVVGQLADIATNNTPSEQRRFFEPPSVVQVKDTLYAEAANSEYDYVLMGTGNRANPLNNITQDRFYAFRDYEIGKMGDTDTNNLADSYPRASNVPISNSASDLIDITTTVLDGSSTAVDASYGWYFDFFTENGNTAGEKVLSAPLTVAGTVLFTTYAPDQNNNLDACAANVGGGNAYQFDILSTRATLDWDADGNIESIGDRKKTLGGGIPSDVVPIFTKEGIVGIVGVEGGASQLGTLADLPRFRTYWYEDS